MKHLIAFAKHFEVNLDENYSYKFLMNTIKIIRTVVIGAQIFSRDIFIDNIIQVDNLVYCL